MTKENTVERISPIRRLINLLIEIQQQKPEIRIIDGWRNIFKLEGNVTITETYPHLIKAKELITECSNLIDNNTDPKNRQEYKKHFNNIEQIIDYPNLHGQMKELQQRINDLMMQALRFCDTEVSKIASENKIKDEEIQELLQEINELKGKLVNSNIEVNTKLFAIELLDSIESALIDYKVLGIESLESTIEKEFLKINFVVNQFYKDDTEEKSIFVEIVRKVWGMVEKADKAHRVHNTILAISAKAPAVIEVLNKLAPPK